MAHCSDEAALGVKGPRKSRIPLHLPRRGPAGTSLAPWKQPPAARSLGTAYVPQPVRLAGLRGREGRKETHNSFPCSTLWAQLFLRRSQGPAQVQPAETESFALLRFHFTSSNRRERAGWGARNNPPSLLKGLTLEPLILGSNLSLIHYKMKKDC